MKKELKKEFKTNQAIEKLKTLNCEIINIYEKGYVVYVSFKMSIAQRKQEQYMIF